ncbi:hypothetical protein ACTJJ0_31945 [Chitinophaga sp. 22321]|uniref:Uncharacterized protein n=1 Tax=Chitinophaga hostae TaxID=2831022 RepID=A0ABS5JA41_9BACT|nr:hypothetical protein [Chitinophaga hostae]MBS0032073.1 hypothetical protein [Chitinophaga hostae]
MNTFYIFKVDYTEVENKIAKNKNATLVFCSSDQIDENSLQAEIKSFYERNYQTDTVLVIGSKHIKDRLLEVFDNRKDVTFKWIPKKQETHFNDNLFIATFDEDATLSCINNKKIPTNLVGSYIHAGLQQIFINRGGLIVSESSHHYVFPSGKHCDRFLRTGNILLYSSEIYFIAYSLLKHFDENIYGEIYCDTSSINSIAIALSELKSRLTKSGRQTPIESFSSYAGLYKSKNSYNRGSLLLVSASTSANIIKYILDKHSILNRNNIVILYFLGESIDYSNIKDQVLCNLTKSEINPNGIPFYETFSEKDCQLCKKGNYAVPVSGDVFLLEKPKINRIILAKDDREKNLSTFVQQFKSSKLLNTVLKAHYKEESPDRKYEVYIDYNQILDGIKQGRYPEYKNKLDHYIDQHVPSNTKFLLPLDDSGSANLTAYILDRIGQNYTSAAIPKVIRITDIPSIGDGAVGSIVVIGSCISNGKNLLYVSRALRRCADLRILYFIGIARNSSKNQLDLLRTNLKMGKYGIENSSYVNIETLYCNNNSNDSPWIVEIEFIKEIQLFLSNTSSFPSSVIDFFNQRENYISRQSGDAERGLSQQLFYPRITTHSPQNLELRKNFAFFDFDDYANDVTQSDVYFTISNILNSLRNSDKSGKQLKQTVYVRNLLDPGNFDRFNDGIIQASILRTTSAEELSYDIDESLSEQMYNLLDTIIEYYEQDQGEALLEFLYAIAIKKLTLKPIHLDQLLKKVNNTCTHPIFGAFSAFIQHKIIDEPRRIKEKTLATQDQDNKTSAEIEKLEPNLNNPN